MYNKVQKKYLNVMEEVMRILKGLYKDGFPSLYSSPNYVRFLGLFKKQNKMGGTCSIHGKSINIYSILVAKPRGTGSLIDFGLN
jgi:hypothetical protein